MRRASSTASLKLLDPDLTDEDVFNPPAGLPGRFLQFTDISLDDDQSVRSVSCPADRVVPAYEDTSGDFVSFRTLEPSSTSCVVHVQSNGSQSQQIPRLLPRPWPRSKVAMIVTSCMTVALTALTLLTFVL